MDKINTEDIQFLDKFFSEEELSDEGLKQLDIKLKNPDFKKYYQKRLNQKYDVPKSRLLASYLPLVLLVALAIIGIYLILVRIEL